MYCKVSVILTDSGIFIICIYIRPETFLPEARIPHGYCSYWGKKVAGGWVGRIRARGRASRFRFRTTVQKLLDFRLCNLAHIWALCSSCAFGGSHCHCIYTFPIIMKNMKKLLFFLSGLELLNGCTCIDKNLS